MLPKELEEKLSEIEKNLLKKIESGNIFVDSRWLDKFHKNLINFYSHYKISKENCDHPMSYESGGTDYFCIICHERITGRCRFDFLF